MTFLELADPGFSVTSALVHQAREDRWYARTSYGIAVLRHDQASRLINHPSLRQGSAAWPAHHGITSGPFADWFANWVLNKENADTLIADRRARPRDDTVTSLVSAHADGDQLTSAELRDTLVLLMFGGFDTTRNQLGLAMQTFLDHPAQWRLLGERPELAPAAVRSGCPWPSLPRRPSGRPAVPSR